MRAGFRDSNQMCVIVVESFFFVCFLFLFIYFTGYRAESGRRYRGMARIAAAAAAERSVEYSHCLGGFATIRSPRQISLQQQVGRAAGIHYHIIIVCARFRVLYCVRHAVCVSETSTYYQLTDL